MSPIDNQPQPVQSPQPAMSSPVLPQANPSKKSFPKMLILLIVILLLIFLGAGAFFLQSKNKKPVAQVSPTVRPTAMQPSPSDATASWKVYTNSFGGFSFKIPQYWITKPVFVVSNTQQSQIIQSPDYTEKPHTTPGMAIEGLASGASLEVSVEKNPSFHSFDELKNFEQKESTEFSFSNFDIQHEITVDKMPAMAVSSSKSYSYIKAATYFFKNGITYKISFNNSNADTSQFMQILSTFTFTQ